jgi:hypothetical protein
LKKEYSFTPSLFLRKNAKKEFLKGIATTTTAYNMKVC